MMKLILITLAGVAAILVLVYGANAEFNVLHGRHISNTQEAVITALKVAAVIVGYALWQWLVYEKNPPLSRTWKKK